MKLIELFSKIVQLIKPKDFQTDIPCLDQHFMHHRIMGCERIYDLYLAKS